MSECADETVEIELRCTCAATNAVGATSRDYHCAACAFDAGAVTHTRFACHCGRFVAESAIRETNHRDDSRYYGVRTEVEWDCSRCGTVKGAEWEPQIVSFDVRTPPGQTTATGGDGRG